MDGRSWEDGEMILANILLALAWTALQGSVTLANLAAGWVLGYFILLMLVKAGVLGPSRYVGRVARFVRLVGFFLFELVVANLRVALDVARPRYRMSPGVIRLPLDAQSDAEILLLAALVNLTPGSVALDVSEDRRVMYVHVMYVSTAEAARAEIKQGFERRVIELLRDPGPQAHV
jgi:multicomponent Na+:H+ antiporter subunit E